MAPEWTDVDSSSIVSSAAKQDRKLANQISQLLCVQGQNVRFFFFSLFTFLNLVVRQHCLPQYFGPFWGKVLKYLNRKRNPDHKMTTKCNINLPTKPGAILPLSRPQQTQATQSLERTGFPKPVMKAYQWQEINYASKLKHSLSFMVVCPAPQEQTEPEEWILSKCCLLPSGCHWKAFRVSARQSQVTANPSLKPIFIGPQS